MKLKLNVLATFILALVFSVRSTSAQSYMFRYDGKEQEEVQETNIKKHLLGEEIGLKMQLLKESYTYKEFNSISRSEMTITEKPSIYNSVKKVSKHLCKGVKKGTIEVKVAQKQLNHIITIALNIRYQDTQQLESELWSTKGIDLITRVFEDKIVMN